MMNTTKAQKARELLMEAVALVEAELTSTQQGKPAVDSVETLNWVKGSLQAMIGSIDTGERIDPPGLWHVATDNWPYISNVRAKVIEAESAYEQLQ